MSGSQKVNLRIQPSLAVGWMAEDSGEWVFTLCKRGMEKLLGRRLKAGETLQVEFSAVELDKE